MSPRSRSSPVGESVSRRDFVRDSLFVAGAVGLTAQAVAAADGAEAPKNAAAAASTGTPHPLDPLSVAEITRAVEIATGDERIPKQSRFVSVMLQEPAKEIVRDHQPGRP